MKFIDLGPKWQKQVPVGAPILFLSYGFGTRPGGTVQTNHAFIRFAANGPGFIDTLSIDFKTLEEAHQAVTEAAAALSVA